MITLVCILLVLIVVVILAVNMMQDNFFDCRECLSVPDGGRCGSCGKTKPEDMFHGHFWL